MCCSERGAVRATSVLRAALSCRTRYRLRYGASVCHAIRVQVRSAAELAFLSGTKGGTGLS
eukprot:3278749-Rhodomonas_salina.3